MPSRIIYLLTMFMYIMTAGYVLAETSLQSLNPDIKSLKPVAIIYFDDGTDIATQHSRMIENMIREASNSFGLKISGYPLPDEDKLSNQVEQISDDGLGLIIIIEPHKIESLSKIPGLYPDIKFTIIGPDTPLYFPNVRSMLFKDQEGAYLMGVLAAGRSNTGTVGFLSKEDNKLTRNLAYAFLQGAKHGNNDVLVTEQLGDEINQNKPTPAETKQLPIAESSADIIFVYDEDLLEPAISAAKAQHRLIISYNHDLTNKYPGIVLTTLLKHYDLAIYHTLHSYTRGKWLSGSQSMGIGNGFLDYELNSSNKALIPKEAIGQLEVNKDFVSQGLIEINTLGK